MSLSYRFIILKKISYHRVITIMSCVITIMSCMCRRTHPNVQGISILPVSEIRLAMGLSEFEEDYGREYHNESNSVKM